MLDEVPSHRLTEWMAFFTLKAKREKEAAAAARNGDDDDVVVEHSGGAESAALMRHMGKGPRGR